MIWETPQVNQGQIVTVSFGWHEGELYRRSSDASDGEVKWWICDDSDPVNTESWDIDSLDEDSLDWNPCSNPDPDDDDYYKPAAIWPSRLYWVSQKPGEQELSGRSHTSLDEAKLASVGFLRALLDACVTVEMVDDVAAGFFRWCGHKWPACESGEASRMADDYRAKLKRQGAIWNEPWNHIDGER